MVYFFLFFWRFFIIIEKWFKSCLDSSEVGLNLAPFGQRSVIGLVLNIDTILDEFAVGPHLLVFLTVPLGEAPLLGDVDLLTTRELELGSPEGLDDRLLMFVVGADGHQGLSNPDASGGTLGFTEGASHSGLKPIGSGTRQHFVDAENVEGVDANADVELILGRVLDHVLVAANTGGLQSLGGELFQFAGDEMDAKGELVDAGLLPAQIVDPDLGVGDTAAEPGLGVGLVFAVAITLRGTATHFGGC